VQGQSQRGQHSNFIAEKSLRNEIEEQTMPALITSEGLFLFLHGFFYCILPLHFSNKREELSGSAECS
jgi:hypothetical protein